MGLMRTLVAATAATAVMAEVDMAVSTRRLNQVKKELKESTSVANKEKLWKFTTKFYKRDNGMDLDVNAWKRLSKHVGSFTGQWAADLKTYVKAEHERSEAAFAKAEERRQEAKFTANDPEAATWTKTSYDAVKELVKKVEESDDLVVDEGAVKKARKAVKAAAKQWAKNVGEEELVSPGSRYRAARDLYLDQVEARKTRRETWNYLQKLADPKEKKAQGLVTAVAELVDAKRAAKPATAGTPAKKAVRAKAEALKQAVHDLFFTSKWRGAWWLASDVEKAALKKIHFASDKDLYSRLEQIAENAVAAAPKGKKLLHKAAGSKKAVEALFTALQDLLKTTYADLEKTSQADFEKKLKADVAKQYKEKAKCEIFGRFQALITKLETLRGDREEEDGCYELPEGFESAFGKKKSADDDDDDDGCYCAGVSSSYSPSASKKDAPKSEASDAPTEEAPPKTKKTMSGPMIALLVVTGVAAVAAVGVLVYVFAIRKAAVPVRH